MKNRAEVGEITGEITCTYLPAYLLTNLPTYPPTCLPTHLPTYSPPPSASTVSVSLLVSHQFPSKAAGGLVAFSATVGLLMLPTTLLCARFISRALWLVSLSVLLFVR